MLKLITITTILFTTNLLADIPEGKELFNESNCMECHEYDHFKADKKKVNSYAKLHKSVEMCAYNNDTGWFDDELVDVVNYLNKDFYRFKDTKK